MIVSESLFTQPTVECPNPEHWTAYDPDTAEVEVIALVGALIRALQPEFVVETGTAHGHTAQAIGEALKANGHGKLTTIEISPARCAEATERCYGLPVTVVCGSSLDYEPSERIDFAYFDSLFELRRPEFEAYQPWFGPRTVFAFHDTGPQHPLRPSLDGLGLVYLPTPRGLAIGSAIPQTREG